MNVKGCVLLKNSSEGAKEVLSVFDILVAASFTSCISIIYSSPYFLAVGSIEKCRMLAKSLSIK